MDVIQHLVMLTGRPNVVLTENGDQAIKAVVSLVHALGRTRVLIPDQGGWLAFRSRSSKVGLVPLELRTDYGIINLPELERKANDRSALLLSSMAGYFAEQPMKRIARICAKKGCLLINDSSGTIGTPAGRIGDVIFGSFGKGKPVHLGYGGFVASDNSEWMARLTPCAFDEKHRIPLARALDALPQRRRFLLDQHHSIVNDLKDLPIIHSSRTGFNVVVQVRNDNERARVLEYCKHHDLATLSCPRPIRVLENAISIEVKRLRGPHGIGSAVINVGKVSVKLGTRMGKASVHFGIQVGKVGAKLYDAALLTFSAISKPRKRKKKS